MWLWVVLALGFYWLAKPFFRKYKTLKGVDGLAVFVTGAASGIGEEVTKQLLERGVFVFAADLNLQRLEQLYKTNSNVRIIQLDVTKQEEVDRAAEIVKNEKRGLFGLINCAGIAFPRKDVWPSPCLIESPVDQDAMMMFQVNVFGLMRMTNSMVPILYATKQQLPSDVPPRILNIASIAGLMGPAWWNYYPATKFSVVGYSDSLRRELQYLGIRVDCIQPGFVDTPLLNPVFHGSVTPVPPSSEAYSAKLLEIKTERLEKGRRSLRRSMPQPVSRVAKIITDVTLSKEPKGDHHHIDHLLPTMFVRLILLVPPKFQDWLLAKI